MTKERVIILGAGLTGLSAAWHCNKKKIGFQLFEKELEVGGLCRSSKKDRFIFDYGGHLLHFRHKSTYNFIKDVLGINLIRHKRNSLVKYLGCDIPYPFQANFSRLTNKKIIQECLEGLKKANQNGRKRKYHNFKSWAYGSFGKGIAEHFMIPYNEKFWKVPTENLIYSWIHGFVPVLKLNDIVNASAHNLKSLGYNANFYYPRSGGIEALPLALEKETHNKIYRGCEVTHIDTKHKEITINYKENIPYDKLISTIPLPEFRNIIGDIPGRIGYYLNALRHNSLLIFNFGIKGHISKNTHWIYFPEKKYSFFRIGFYSSFSSKTSSNGNSSIYVEFSYSVRETIEKEKLKQAIVKDLVMEKIISSRNDIVSSEIIDIKYGYPIYDKNYQNAVKEVLRFLLSCGIYSIGRYGSWRYMTMEDALLDGKRISEGI